MNSVPPGMDGVPSPNSRRFSPECMAFLPPANAQQDFDILVVLLVVFLIEFLGSML